MQNRLREALARLWTSLWRRHGPVAVKTKHEQGGGWPEARARFWTKFREGRREAEAHGSPGRQGSVFCVRDGAQPIVSRG